MIIEYIKKRKKLSFITAGLTALVVVLAGALPGVFATTEYYLTNGAVELNGTDDGTVTINFNTPIADIIYSIEGNFLTSVADSEGTYFTLTAMTPGGGISPSASSVLSNTIADGRVFYQDWNNGMTLGIREAMWSATYTVDKDTPAGDYDIKFFGAMVSSDSENWDTIPLGDLTATVTVTRSDAPATKPRQVVTFRDNEGNAFTEIDKFYGDENFTVTKEVTTGDGAIIEYHPNDGESEHPGSVVHTIPGSDLVGVNGVGDMEICARVEETENYAETTVCYTVHVHKRPIEVSSAVVSDKDFDGVTDATITSISFIDRDLSNSDYTATAHFSDANAGENKTVSISLALQGDALNNYVFNSSTYNTTATIRPYHLINDEVSLPHGDTYVYDPEGITPEVRVEASTHGGSTTLIENTDYEVSYSDNFNQGTGHVYVTGKGNYTTGDNPIIKDFTISKKEITDSDLIIPSSVVEGHILAPSEVRVNVDGHELVRCETDGANDCDFVVAISNNTGVVGDVISVTASGRNNYSGSASGTINILAKLEQVVTLGAGVAGTTVYRQYGDSKFTYTASTNGDGEITFTSSDTNVVTVDRDSGQVTIVGIGDAIITATAAETDTYAEGSASYTVSVSKRVVTVSGVTVANKAYDGTTSATVTTAVLSEGSLALNTDFTASAVFSSAEVGERVATVTITLSSETYAHYCFELSGSYVDSVDAISSATITAFTLGDDNATATLSSTSFEYSGSENKPTATLSVDLDGDGVKETPLLAGTDYEITYSEDTVNAGAKVATITGKGNYSGNLPGLDYTVTAATVTDVVVDVTNATFTGEALEPTVTVSGKVNGADKTFSADEYEIAAHDAFVNAGSYSFSVASPEGSNYNIPATSATFEISKHALAVDDVTLEYTTIAFNGDTREPSVTVKIGDYTVDPSEYDVEYSGDTVGSIDADATPAVKITAKEDANITGWAAFSYTITANGVYEVIRGAGQIYYIDSEDDAEFEIDANYSLFVDGGLVFVDDEQVDEENFESRSGSTVIALKADFVKSLALGEHSFKVVFNNEGEAETTFTVAEPEPEAPGAADTGVFTSVGSGATVTGATMLFVLVLAGVVYTIRKEGREA